MDGTWKSGDYWLGIRDGITDLSPINDQVPEAVKVLVRAKREEFISGKVRAFDGPVKDQAGKLRVATGKTLSDAEQLKMDWFVEGIEGSSA